ncbi:MAG TPA: sigma-54 dependent transcriptional regulator [Candidatus Binatia bacterium]|jgi:DNA-binding NtrC family response regulator|nr:sigma-54 dependent transcriptional regulator [Candidatus Binatia bacterium]
MARILLIEDDEDTARLITRVLGEPPETCEVTVARSQREGLARLDAGDVDCVLLDYRLPDVDGLGCLRAIRRAHPDLPVVMVTGAGSEEIAVDAIQLGAANYLVKHGRWLQAVPVAVRAALGQRELRRSNARYRRKLRASQQELTRLRQELSERYRLDGIVGQSPAIAQAIECAERAAASSSRVMIEGETGTGKELFARAIHYHGPRATKPFEAINCAALPEQLMEAELFGHTRGAFSGADHARRGLFEMADGGTLFLDEVTELSLTMQAKLLRVVEDGVVRPLGSEARRTVNVRIIAATNRPLAEAVRRGQFRDDLRFRLSVLSIRLPALRERRGDIRLLAAHFLEEIAAREGRSFRGFEPVTLQLLDAYEWPGNVRQLRNEIERLVNTADDGERIAADLLSPEVLEAPVSDREDGARTLREVVRSVETTVVAERLREYGWHRGKTADSLGVTREWLWVKIRQLGLVVPPRAE